MNNATLTSSALFEDRTLAEEYAKELSEILKLEVEVRREP